MISKHKVSYLLRCFFVARPQLGVDELGYEFRWFVDAGVDEVLEALLHPVDELRVPAEAVLDYLIQLFL